MKKQNFYKGILALQRENGWLKYSMLFSTLTIMILCFAMTTRSQIVTIVPPNLNETAWIDKSTASSPFMRAWALYIANSLGNASPQNADLLKQSVGPFLSSHIYNQVMKSIDDQIDKIKQDHISLSFLGTSVITDTKDPGNFFVEGTQSIEGITGNPTSKSVVFNIKINIHGYVPTITFIDIKNGRAEVYMQKGKNGK